MRLITGGVEITWTKDKKSAGALVSGYFRDDETGQYVVSFNQKWPNFMKLATP
jgi:hypothetical protein